MGQVLNDEETETLKRCATNFIVRNYHMIHLVSADGVVIDCTEGLNCVTNHGKCLISTLILPIQTLNINFPIIEEALTVAIDHNCQMISYYTNLDIDAYSYIKFNITADSGIIFNIARAFRWDGDYAPTLSNLNAQHTSFGLGIYNTSSDPGIYQGRLAGQLLATQTFKLSEGVTIDSISFLVSYDSW